MLSVLGCRGYLTDDEWEVGCPGDGMLMSLGVMGE